MAPRRRSKSRRTKARSSRKRRTSRRVDFYTKDGKHVSFSPKKKAKSTRKKSPAQKRHQARAKQAMNLYHTGRARTLKSAWRMI
jgi:hypothetical protein